MLQGPLTIVCNTTSWFVLRLLLQLGVPHRRGVVARGAQVQIRPAIVSATVEVSRG